MWQTLNISIWQLSAILLLTSSPLKLCQVGWGRRTFSGFSRKIWLRSSQGSGWATQGHSQNCLYATLAVCLGSLSCWKMNLLPRLRFWMLWTRFSLILSQYFEIHSMRLLPAHFTFGMVLCRWWAVPGFFQTWCLELRFVRPENLVSQVLFLQMPIVFSCVFTEERIESCHTTVKPRSVECCSDVCPSVCFSYLHVWSWSSTIVTIRFLDTTLTKALLHPLLSLARRPALGRVLVVSNFFH